MLGIIISTLIYVQVVNAQILQYQDTGLKTYYNPKVAFSIKYPDFDGETKITETLNDGPWEDRNKRLHDCPLNDVKCILDIEINSSKVHVHRAEFDHPDFVMKIEETEAYSVDLQRMAMSDMVNYENTLDWSTIEDVRPVIYDAILGYTFTSLKSPKLPEETGVLIKSVYLHDYGYLYKIRIFVPPNENSIKQIDEILNSLKIFDLSKLRILGKI